MKGYRKYFGQKLLWFFITLIVAVALNFVLPRLMPTDPVNAITGKIAGGMSDSSAIKEVYEFYQKQFGLDKPMITQFFLFVKNALRGDFGISFSQYPRTVADIISSSIGWTLALQIPAIIVGWILVMFSALSQRISVASGIRALCRSSCSWAMSPHSLWLSFCWCSSL